MCRFHIIPVLRFAAICSCFLLSFTSPSVPIPMPIPVLIPVNLHLYYHLSPYLPISHTLILSLCHSLTLFLLLWAGGVGCRDWRGCGQWSGGGEGRGCSLCPARKIGSHQIRYDKIGSDRMCSSVYQLVNLLLSRPHHTPRTAQYSTGYYYILSFLCNPLTGRPTTVIKYHRYFIAIAIFFFFIPTAELSVENSCNKWKRTRDSTPSTWVLVLWYRLQMMQRNVLCYFPVRPNTTRYSVRSL